MKKAKVMLTAIAVFAVVGGALAFKAKKFGGSTYYVSTTTTLSATATYSPALITANTAPVPVYYVTRVFGAPLTSSTQTAKLTIVP
ncbi:hypothetical protein SAMN04488505_104240 [Chitinophaga rupis]|uniref:Uncharacterized protein n=1 Tax=Chitinophaga rupis TaxID=573321 RepID=A0A1H7XXS0_9BACT|nr:hypothetical protein [Chitinophaga rupis]SEM38620.1 hypothetical protein SAMN04488505_104240 [Chitinophaga rupis]